MESGVASRRGKTYGTKEKLGKCDLGNLEERTKKFGTMKIAGEKLTYLRKDRK